MIILTIRTDNPEAEIGLYDATQGDVKQLAYETWQAHRALAETLHAKLNEILKSCQFKLKDVDGIVCYRGPGSFTGLRIGLTVANALSYSLNIPIASDTGATWQQNGIERLGKGENEKVAMPEYGADVHITLPKQ